MLTFGSLFSGIGGFDIGFERAGMKCVWQVENDEYCRKVLEKHWPDVKRYGDIRTIRELPYADVICGGFPCQDISVAGKQKGITGERSSLWFEFLRIIKLVRPALVVIENSPNLLKKGLGTVLRGLAEAGYDAEWDYISASDVGAPHRRKRIFVVAYSDSERCGCWNNTDRENERAMLSYEERDLQAQHKEGDEMSRQAETSQINASDNGRKRVQRFFPCKIQKFQEFSWCENVRRIEDLRNRQDIPESLIRRTCDGFSSRVYRSRIRCLGNAVVPAIAEVIGRRIVEMRQSHNNVSTELLLNKEI